MEKEFTATSYIIDGDKFLLVYHHKLQKWIPPGGHIEKNETPAEAARREVLEETGFEIEFIKQENIWLHYPNASSFERPYLCLLENIPPYKDRPAHQHVDFVYVARPLSNMNDELPENCCWFGLDDLKKLEPEVEIFQEVLDTIHSILSSQEMT